MILLTKGSKNKISTSAIWTCDFLCDFDYKWYPFDTQNCYAHFSVFDDTIRARIVNVTYSGEQDLGKYYFKEINSCDYDKNGRNGVYVDITYNSPMTAHIMTLFLPTGMLLLISQLSTIFGSKFVDMVIEVNTTLLLVLTT